MSREEKGKVKPKRDRYWSVMLVGDHGRIIPFRHFKTLAIVICGGFILALIALVVLALLYTRQGQQLGHLRERLADMQLQNSKLRDEKDLYLTRMTVKRNQQAEKTPKELTEKPSPPKTPEREEKSSPASHPSKAPPKPAPVVKEAPKPSKPKPPVVKWMADVRRFSMDYKPERGVLKAQFRIYNTSKPKKPLAGRCVVVLKNLDDPPIKWLSVPRVQLDAGTPAGDHGQAFKINNYRTLTFRAYGQKAPVQYNTASVFIFTGDGQLIANKDFAFKVKYTPPKEKAPEKPAPQEPASSTPKEKQSTDKGAAGAADTGRLPSPAPAMENSDSSGQVKPDVPAQTAPAAQTPDAGSAVQQDAPDKPAQTVPDLPATSTERETGISSESAPTPQAPQTVPKPQVEGDQQ